MNQSNLDDFVSSGVECPTCGRDDFASEKGMKWHHSVMHNESISGWDLECEICGDEFHAIQNPEERRFCSHSCVAEHQRDYTDCKNCGEAFFGAYNNSSGEFCSRECHSQYNRTTIECEECEESVSVPNCQQDRVYCSMRCKGQAQSRKQSGSDNPYWRGGRDFYTRVRANLSDDGWRQIAEESRGNHGHCCYKCGISQDKLDRKLDVHHIIPVMDGGTNGQWNLIPLCNSCHKSVEWYTVHNITGTEAILVDYEDNHKHNKSNRGEM